MNLSDDKITHLSNLVLKGLLEKKLIKLKEEHSVVRKEIRRSIVEELKIGEEIDQIVRKKLQSSSKKLVEGSPEWEVLYKKFFREEEIKRGRIAE
ncbi:MAG: DUF507 family protein [Thermodesulfovibrionales bacterium]